MTLVGNYSKPERLVNNKDKPVTEIQEQRNRWVGHFKGFLNRPAPLNTLDIKTTLTDLLMNVTSPTIEEIRMSTRQMKSGKAAGPEHLPVKALNSDMEVTSEMLSVLFMNI
ncbi:unnamed protein product [Schistosoma curassoni]|uniref:Uncharacterized protein n=1 Tax=Schistosoma curassoni TaxID=6186 RepID=A0A183JT40_9TREM|nr:unnamed protein product [Schistosoma curassoni]